jgi:hypothetical protein
MYVESRHFKLSHFNRWAARAILTPRLGTQIPASNEHMNQNCRRTSILITSIDSTNKERTNSSVFPFKSCKAPVDNIMDNIDPHLTPASTDAAVTHRAAYDSIAPIGTTITGAGGLLFNLRSMVHTRDNLTYQYIPYPTIRERRFARDAVVRGLFQSSSWLSYSLVWC